MVSTAVATGGLDGCRHASTPPIKPTSQISAVSSFKRCSRKKYRAPDAPLYHDDSIGDKSEIDGQQSRVDRREPGCSGRPQSCTELPASLPQDISGRVCSSASKSDSGRSRTSLSLSNCDTLKAGRKSKAPPPPPPISTDSAANHAAQPEHKQLGQQHLQARTMAKRPPTETSDVVDSAAVTVEERLDKANDTRTVQNDPLCSDHSQDEVNADELAEENVNSKTSPTKQKHAALKNSASLVTVPPRPTRARRCASIHESSNISTNTSRVVEQCSKQTNSVLSDGDVGHREHTENTETAMKPSGKEQNAHNSCSPSISTVGTIGNGQNDTNDGQCSTIDEREVCTDNNADSDVNDSTATLMHAKSTSADSRKELNDEINMNSGKRIQTIPSSNNQDSTVGNVIKAENGVHSTKEHCVSRNDLEDHSHNACDHPLEDTNVTSFVDLRNQVEEHNNVESSAKDAKTEVEQNSGTLQTVKNESTTGEKCTNTPQQQRIFFEESASHGQIETSDTRFLSKLPPCTTSSASRTEKLSRVTSLDISNETTKSIHQTPKRDNKSDTIVRKRPVTEQSRRSEPPPSQRSSIGDKSTASTVIFKFQTYSDRRPVSFDSAHPQSDHTKSTTNLTRQDSPTNEVIRRKPEDRSHTVRRAESVNYVGWRRSTPVNVRLGSYLDNDASFSTLQSGAENRGFHSLQRSISTVQPTPVVVNGLNRMFSWNHGLHNTNKVNNTTPRDTNVAALADTVTNASFGPTTPPLSRVDSASTLSVGVESRQLSDKNTQNAQIKKDEHNEERAVSECRSAADTKKRPPIIAAKPKPSAMTRRPVSVSGQAVHPSIATTNSMEAALSGTLSREHVRSWPSTSLVTICSLKQTKVDMNENNAAGYVSQSTDVVDASLDATTTAKDPANMSIKQRMAWLKDNEHLIIRRRSP